jgi:hypothetical protein
VGTAGIGRAHTRSVAAHGPPATRALGDMAIVGRARMTARERRCSECGVPLVRRPKETDAQWGERRYCSLRCAGTGTAKREKAHTRSMGDAPHGHYAATAACQTCRTPIVYTGRCFSCSTGRPRTLTPETVRQYAAMDREGRNGE